ncbi:MAG: EAL domain-containing protein [Chloroflexota bacterium]|nr:EAL domain-containing protein [Chloroflexota bacterium]
MRDLSTNHRAAGQDAGAEALFQSLVEHLPGVAYADEIGGIGRYVSPQIESIFGYTPAQWLGDSGLWERRLHPEDRRRAVAELAAGEAAGGTFTYLYRLRARNGRTIWVRDQAAVLRTPDGPVVHGVMFDVTREMGFQADLELEISERRRVGEALQRLPAARPALETAAAICRELSRLQHVDVAVLYEFALDGSVIPLGLTAGGETPVQVGQPIPDQRAQYLRESATGPWIDEWRGMRGEAAYLRSWHRFGLKIAAYAPFGNGGTVHGLLAIGSTSAIGTTVGARWLPSLTEIASVAGALLVPELDSRRSTAETRVEVERLIADRGFASVFQPVVRINDGSVVGYEALTRFADGTPPQTRFAEAEAVGMGTELEAAAARSALVAAAKLPSRAWVSINVSPAWLDDPRLLRLLELAKRRPVVLEITERMAIDDYPAARAALDQLAGSVDIAVDDAGAGFASLRHVVELRPRYVKLDLALVRGIESDPARQAMVAGMVYFARDTGCLLIAEGLEHASERDVLRRLGVPFAQGFLFGRPAPAEAWRRLGVEAGALSTLRDGLPAAG